MNNEKEKEIRKESKNKVWLAIKPVVMLVLICAITSAILSATNVLTAPVIAEQQRAAEEAAKREVLPKGMDFAPIDISAFNAVIVGAEEAGNGEGWVFTTEANGYGGTIRAMFGINADGVMTGSKVVDHSETQGVGSKVVSNGSDYHKQLLGMKRADTSGIVATSGASFSSAAMKRAVTAVFDAYAILVPESQISTPAAPAGDTAPGQPASFGAGAPTNITWEALAEYYGDTIFAAVPGGLISDAGTVVYSSGYGAFSDVLVAVLFDNNDSIIGLIVDASGETPDRGIRCMDRAYTDLFIGVTSGKDVDVLSGASFTSWGIQDAVDAALENVATVKASVPELPEGADKPAFGAGAPTTITWDAVAEYYGDAVFAASNGGLVSDAGTIVYGSGYGAFSDVLVAVLFDSNDSIIGLIVDASGETPDRGIRCMDRAYTDLYIGATSGKDVDVLSGASFTSWGVQDAVDMALANLASVKAG